MADTPTPTFQLRSMKVLFDDSLPTGADPQTDLAYTSAVALSGDKVLLTSARWMVAWQLLVPVMWITRNFIAIHQTKKAILMALYGLVFMIWNLVHIRTALTRFCWGDDLTLVGRVSSTRKVVILLGQMLLALLCTHLATNQNPEGMKHWFWMSLPAFAVMMLNFRQVMFVVITALVLGTAQNWYFLNGFWAANWFLAQISINTFIVICMIAATFASRERRQVVRIAQQLNIANVQLEAQADQTAMLAVAQERNRLAREIHDSVGHSLTVVGAQLDAAAALMAQSPELARASLEKARISSAEGLAEIRRSLSALHSSPIDGHSLSEVLPRLASTFDRPGVRVTVRISGEVRQLPALAEMTLYRCGQEGLTNACRHSQASEIELHLDFRSNSQVSLAVSDNGKGFAPDATDDQGLRGLRERAALLHGSFQAGTGPHGGGLCEIIIPV